MTMVFDAQPKSFEEAIDLIQASESLRKIKVYIDNSNLSADMKAIMYDIAKFSVKLGEKVVYVGRQIISLAMALVRKYPNMLLGAAVGAVIVAVTGSVLGAIPGLGALALFLSKLGALIAVGKGFFEDLRHGIVKTEMDRVAAQFSALNMGVVQR